MQDSEVKRWFRNLERGDFITAKEYMSRLIFFCNHYRITPNQLASIGVKAIEKKLQNFISLLESKDKAHSHLISYKKAIRSWANWNGKDIKVMNSDRKHICYYFRRIGTHTES